MSVRLQIKDKDGLFFITFTCQDWLPLFEITKGYDTVYLWFDYLKSKGHFIIGYVILPNHLHVIIGLNKSEKSIHTLVSNGKRFMAYELVKRLRALERKDILDRLSSAVSASDAKRGKLHQVFEPSFDCKECINEKFTETKLLYIQNNPCKGKWNLAASPQDYKHSSARCYILGEHAVYPVTNFRELHDCNLT